MIKNNLIRFLQEEVKKANAKGLVVGVSGGVDSAVVAHLIKETFPDASFGVWIGAHSSAEAKRNALRVLEHTKLDHSLLDISDEVDGIAEKSLLTKDIYENEEIYAKFEKDGINPLDEEYRLTDEFVHIKGNIKSRLRTSVLYAIAQKNNYLVVGTSNASENYIGYFTKHGDNAVDIQPLVNLTKTEVYQLAKELNVNERVINAAPSADLRRGQTDEDDLGFKYDDLDKLLNGEEIDQSVKEKIETMHNDSKHKRTSPVEFKK